MTPIHATAVAIRGRGVLFVGPSGSGKSDLALRLIDRGATLVADDRVVLTRDGDRVLASSPATIAGLIEVRGVGIVAVPHAAGVPVALVVDLAAPPARLPDPATRDVAGLAVPVVALAAFEASAALKVEAALAAIGGAAALAALGGAADVAAVGGAAVLAADGGAAASFARGSRLSR